VEYTTEVEDVPMPGQYPIGAKGFSPFRELVGVTFTKVENGYSHCFLEVDKKLLNPARIVHGGAIYTLADSGMGVALYSLIDEGELFLTIEANIFYFKAVSSGTLTCESRVVHRGKRIAVMEAEIKNEGELVAKAMGTFSIYKGKKV
jgi:acyl-CoA thioesterase